MSESNSTLNQNISDGLLKYSLLEIILHVMGNGLGAISGYTQLLQRVVAIETQETCSSEQNGWQQQQERCLCYLQTMRQRETLLNDFLIQLRDFSPEAMQDRFSECLVRVDLVLLLQRIIGRLAPLHQGRTIQIDLPAQPLYIMCDLLWMEIGLEHIINHTVDAHTLSTPVSIEIKREENPSTRLPEARIALHIHSGLLEQASETEEPLKQKELEICRALCEGILHQHGGRFEYKQEAGQAEAILFLILPLIE